MNLAFLATLRSYLSGGSLKIGRGANIRYLPRFRYRKGTIKIGDRLSVRSGVVIDAQSGSVEIGNDVSINDYSILLGHGGIRIGNDVRIAAHVVIVSFDHSYEDADVLIRQQPVKKEPIVIGNDVWIGAGAKILAGAHVADGCVIGANSVVKGATVPFGIYVGAPARLVKKRTAHPG